MFLKKKDLQLISELELNASQSYSQIGKKIKMSQQLISHKLNKFIKKHLISHFYALIDYSRLGYHSFTVFFNLNYHNRNSFEKIVQVIQQHENVLEIKECDGKYDLIVTFAAKNPSSFNKKLKQLTFDIAELTEKTILTNIVTHSYPRNYLCSSKNLFDYLLGGDKEEITLDKLDLQLLSQLSLGRKKILELSKLLKISPKTTLTRKRHLERLQIIRGYRAQLNYSSLGLFANQILIKYNDHAFQQDQKLTSFCKFNPNIIEMVKTFGEWDALLLIETKTPREFRKLYLEIRETFDNMIAEIDSVSIYDVPEIKFFPKAAELVD